MPGIEQWIPHRKPFLFIDELVEMRPDGGRFVLRLAPDDPRLDKGTLKPLLLVEALAQTTAALAGHEHPERPERGLLVDVSATFHGDGHGGDVIDLDVHRVRTHGALHRYSGRATVGDRLLVEAELTVMREEPTPNA